MKLLSREEVVEIESSDELPFSRSPPPPPPPFFASHTHRNGNPRLSAAGTTAASLGLQRFTHVKELLKTIDGLVEKLSGKVKRLKNVKHRSDAMLAVYDGKGSRFQKHVDNTAKDGRRLTVLVYLNPEWKLEDGGALEIFPVANVVKGVKEEGGPKPAAASSSSSSSPSSKEGEVKGSASDAAPASVVTYPLAGRLAMFYSEQIPHAVMPTFAPRYALTVWYYDREECYENIERAESEVLVAETKKAATAETRAEAQRFIEVRVCLCRF